MARASSMIALPRKRFGAILADPPWHFAMWSTKGRDRCPDSKHYQTMSTEEIAALDVRRLALDDCALFLWITWPMLKEGLFVLEQWGFQYKTCAFAWMKTTKPPIRVLVYGTGYWTRANTEVCLLGTRGKPKRLNNNIGQAILEPRREHSRKPDCVHERIECLVAGPYLELFARNRHKGWRAWGNQLE